MRILWLRFRFWWRDRNKKLCDWCITDMGDEICFNSKTLCIPCCITAGNPCQH